MANILGIDLDTTELRLVELQPSGGGCLLHAALTLPLGALDAASLGAELKNRLAEVGFKSTQTVIALGSDAFLCKEVRHPEIPHEELPAIVQFQVQKESPLPPDASIIDYVPLKQPLPTGERRSLTYVARKARVQFCQKLCEAAGLKLLAVVPRAAALLAGAPPEVTSGPAAGLIGGGTFAVVEQGDLIFNRALGSPADAAEFFGEIKRTLAGYDALGQMPKLASLFLANVALPPGYEAHLPASRVPITLYDPYALVQGEERLVGHGDYAAAAGAALSARQIRSLPINFLNPKRVIIKPNRNKSYAIIGGVTAAALLLLGYGLYWMLTSSSDTEIAGLQTRIAQLKEQEKTHGDVQKRFDQINAWSNQEVVVLDALYDLIAAFPDMGGIQIVKVEWKPIATTVLPQALAGKTAPAPAKGPTVKPIATLSIVAHNDQGDPEANFRRLENALRENWTILRKTPDLKDRNRYTFDLSVLPSKPAEYTTVLTPGKYTTMTGEVQTNPTPRRRPRFNPQGGRP